MSEKCCSRFRFKANANGFLSAKNSPKVKADIIVSINQPISDCWYTEGDCYLPSCVCFVLRSHWRWINTETVALAVFQTGKPAVEDLFSDLCDGRRLLQLLEGLVGHQLVRSRPLTCPESAAALKSRLVLQKHLYPWWLEAQSRRQVKVSWYFID